MALCQLPLLTEGKFSVTTIQTPNMSVKRAMKEQVVEWDVLVSSTFLIVLLIPEVFVTHSVLVMGTANHTKRWMQGCPMVPT
jgi:hypothetical protein